MCFISDCFGSVLLFSPLRKFLVCIFSSLSSIFCISHFLLHYFNCVSFFWVLRRLLSFSYTSLMYIFLEHLLLVTVSNMNFNLTMAFFFLVFKQSVLISFILPSCLNQLFITVSFYSIVTKEFALHWRCQEFLEVFSESYPKLLWEVSFIFWIFTFFGNIVHGHMQFFSLILN